MRQSLRDLESLLISPVNNNTGLLIMQEKYSFVYIWRDRKHKRYYIGCHWGTENDGYICSSTWMKHSYKKRPDDFKRRILIRVYTNRVDLFEEEYKWLCKIKEDELKIRYYNLHNHKFGHWTTDPEKSKTTKQRMMENQRKAYDSMSSEERKEKFGKGRRGKTSEKKGKSFEELYGKYQAILKKEHLRKINLGKIISQEVREKLKKHQGPNKGKKMSEETKQKMSESAKKRKRGLLSEETKRKIGEKNHVNMTNKWKNDDYRKMQIESHHGHKHTKEHKRKQSVSLRKYAEKNRKISIEMMEEIRLTRKEEKLTYTQLSEKFGISRTQINRIITNPKYGIYDDFLVV